MLGRREGISVWLTICTLDKLAVSAGDWIAETRKGVFGTWFPLSVIVVVLTVIAVHYQLINIHFKNITKNIAQILWCSDHQKNVLTLYQLFIMRKTLYFVTYFVINVYFYVKSSKSSSFWSLRPFLFFHFFSFLKALLKSPSIPFSPLSLRLIRANLHLSFPFTSNFADWAYFNDFPFMGTFWTNHMGLILTSEAGTIWRAKQT